MKNILLLFFAIFLSGCSFFENRKEKRESEMIDEDFINTISKKFYEKIESNIYKKSDLTSEKEIQPGSNEVILEYKYYQNVKNALDAHWGYNLYIIISKVDQIKLNERYPLINNSFDIQFSTYSAWGSLNNNDINNGYVIFKKLNNENSKLLLNIEIKEIFYEIDTTNHYYINHDSLLVINYLKNDSVEILQKIIDQEIEINAKK